MKISRQELIKCGWCLKLSKLGDWNDTTYSKCVTKDMKDSFIPLDNSSSFNRDSKAYYICPLCNMWSKGSQLKIINSKNKKLESLGGENINILGYMKHIDDN